MSETVRTRGDVYGTYRRGSRGTRAARWEQSRDRGRALPPPAQCFAAPATRSYICAMGMRSNDMMRSRAVLL